MNRLLAIVFVVAVSASAQFTYREQADFSKNSAKVFTVSAATDLVYVYTHGYETGTPVEISTMNSMPGGLTSGTVYWVIANDANSFKLATTLANAVNGTSVDITSAGAGTFRIVEDVATWLDIVDVAIAINAKNVLTGALTLAAVNGGTGGTNISASQLMEWARRAGSNPSSVRQAMMAQIMAHGNFQSEGINITDAHLLSAVQDAIKSTAVQY